MGIIQKKIIKKKKKDSSGNVRNSKIESHGSVFAQMWLLGVITAAYMRKCIVLCSERLNGRVSELCGCRGSKLYQSRVGS